MNLNFSEKEIEDMIFKDLVYNSGMTLHKRGLKVHPSEIIHASEFSDIPNVRWFRQLNFGVYGIADIVGYFRHYGVLFIELIELKAVPIRAEDFDQICRYRTAISKIVPSRMERQFNMTLIGPDIDSGHYIHNHLRMKVATYDYDLDGFLFEEHLGGGDWHRDGFKFDIKKVLQDAKEVH